MPNNDKNNCVNEEKVGPKVFQQLLCENWRLQTQVVTLQEEQLAFRSRIRYLEDSAEFVTEKIRLEDVIASLMETLALERSSSAAAANNGFHLSAANQEGDSDILDRLVKKSLVLLDGENIAQYISNIITRVLS